MGIYQMGGQNLSLDFWKAKYHDHLRSLKPGVHIIKVHIAFQTKELQNITGMHDSSIRQMDYDVWTSDDTKKLAEELGIIFIGYRPLQQLAGKINEIIKIKPHFLIRGYQKNRFNSSKIFNRQTDFIE